MSASKSEKLQATASSPHFLQGWARARFGGTARQLVYHSTPEDQWRTYGYSISIVLLL